MCSKHHYTYIVSWRNIMLISYNYIDWPIVSAKFMLITIMFTKLNFFVICAQYLV